MAIRIVVGFAAALIVVWLVLVGTLLVRRPDRGLLAEAVRILPDTIRLLRRLAADRSVGRAVRLRLWLLFAYLAFPIDLVPDFIPVLGHADDAILVAVVLRAVVRRSGPEAVRRNWPGSEQGLDAIWRLARLERAAA